jgi:hypothetical protein
MTEKAHEPQAGQAAAARETNVTTNAIAVTPSQQDSPPPMDDWDMVARTTCLIASASSEAVTELRMLNVHNGRYSLGTVAGYFNRADLLADAAQRYGPHAKGVYLVINEVNPVLLARAANRVVERVEGGFSTKDADILNRRWLPVDLDPVRPSGVPASDEEHDLALERGRTIKAWLSERGWPDPIMGDSGNGSHLLYRVNLPADDGGLVEQCLRALAVRFDDPRVKVDVTVANASRIWRLYGVTNRKGDTIPGRPRRLARLLEVPAVLEPAPVEAVTS